MRQDPVLGPTIRRPVKVLGVQDYGEDGATLRAFVETVPGRQWRVGRELEARIRRSLAARGMAVAYPGVMRPGAARPAEPTDHSDSAA
jgi:moderate conductance mechanosensitive channel